MVLFEEANGDIYVIKSSMEEGSTDWGIQSIRCTTSETDMESRFLDVIVVPTVGIEETWIVGKWSKIFFEIVEK